MSLQLRDARYTYPATSRAVLDGIDLDVPSGRVVAVVGANDAGKSTLCLVAAGLAPRSIGGRLEGSVLLDGAESVSLEPHEAAQRCGILFQNALTQLSGTAPTVFEEVAFGPMNLGLPRDEVIVRTWRSLERLRIETLAEREPARLSGGQQQLVAVAGLLAMEPKHLVLDEPTAQLDPAGTRLVADAIAELAAAGASILVAEQKTDLLAAIADDVLVLDGGRMAMSGSTATVLADPGLDALGIALPSATALVRAASVAGLDPAPIQAAVG